MAVRLLRKSWWIDIQFNHARYRIRSPENSRAGALAYEATIRQKLARGEAPRLDRRNAPQDKQFEQFAQEWFREYVTPNNKHSERKAKRYILRASLIPFFGKMRVGDITTHHVERYKARLADTGVSNKTINNRLTVLSTCLSAAHEWLQLEASLPKIKRLKCHPSRTDYLSAQECDLLLACASGVTRELILAALRTGMRQGELRGLQWNSIDWENRTLTVRHSWNDEIKALEPPKSNRERIIPLSGDLYETFSIRRRTSGFVFVDDDGTPFSEKRLNPRLAKVCGRAGVRRITFHVLRHSFASHLAIRGVPLGAVQALLGHSSVTTTMRYAHVPSSALRDAVDVLNPSQSFGQPVDNAWFRTQITPSNQNERMSENLGIAA